MILKLAWRNLWRNRTRSLITMGSVFFAVILATVMSALQLGTYDRMIANVAGIQTGFLQVHQAGYWDDPVLDNSFAPTDSLHRRMQTVGGVREWIPRLESFALASQGNVTTGARITGVDPEREKTVTDLKNKISAGEYLRPQDDGVLLGEGLAKHMALRPGDSVVLLGQGYHGTTAAGVFPVRGLLRFASPELNDRMAYLSLSAAQRFYGAEGQVTGLIGDPENRRDLPHILSALRAALGPGYEAMGWEDMLPDLKQGIQADRAGFLVMIGVLYLIIAFGIFGTLTMMAYERKREFSILVSLGMRQGRLAAMVLLESLLLSGLGVLAGMTVSLPLAVWLHFHPIRFTGQAAEAYSAFGFEPVMPASLQPDVFWTQALFVLAVAVVMALFPAWRTLKSNPMEGRGR